MGEEYIARGEILGEDGEKWLQEVQLGECDNEDQAGELVSELMDRGDLDAWLWVRIYRLTFVQSLRNGEP